MTAFLRKISFYAIIVLLYYGTTAIYNYSIDPYGILERRKEFIGIRPNEHSLKVHYVLQNANKFNSFLFSNSKGGALHFNELNNEKDKWYNMTYSLGTPEEFYHDMLLFLKNDINVKNIVVGLDEGVIYERASSHLNQASRKFVPMEEDIIHWEFLFLPISFKKMSEMDTNKKHIIHNIYQNGNYYERNAYPYDCASSENPEFIPHPERGDIRSLDFSSQLEIFNKIRKLCEDNHIELTFLVHPRSVDNYNKSTEKLQQFKNLLTFLRSKGFVFIEPYKNRLMKNTPCFWLDRHHYTNIIGDSILQIFIENKGERPINLPVNNH